MDGSLALKTMVVLVEDDREWMVRMKRLAEERGHPVIEVNPYEAISFVMNGLERPAVFLVNDDMHEFDYPGIRLIKHLNRIKAYPLLSFLVSSHYSEELFAQALDADALGYLSKDMPFELIMKYIERAERLILSDLIRAERLDPLTGIYGVYDREGGKRKFRHIWMLARKKRSITSLVFFDAIGLGKVNEKYGKTYGYGPGDKVVKAEAKLLQAHRPSDTVVRFGGDEMFVILQGTSEREAKKFLARCKREAPKDLIELVPGDYFRLYLSGGVASVMPKDLGEDPDTLYEQLLKLAQKNERLDKPRTRKQVAALARRMEDG